MQSGYKARYRSASCSPAGRTEDHGERNHQGLDNALICPNPGHAVAEGKVYRRERLGGLLNYYYCKAA
jgi:hypothetical protein